MVLIRLLLMLVLVVGLGAAGVYAAVHQGLIPQEQLAKFPILSDLSSEPDLTTVLNSSHDSLKILSSTAQSAGQVLGSQVEVQEQPLPQRAFEFARYSYCQEVVKDYEKRFPQE
jgi:hypothetical protein